jgi:hypothetical protein
MGMLHKKTANKIVLVSKALFLDLVGDEQQPRGLQSPHGQYVVGGLHPKMISIQTGDFESGAPAGIFINENFNDVSIDVIVDVFGVYRNITKAFVKSSALRELENGRFDLPVLKRELRCFVTILPIIGPIAVRPNLASGVGAVIIGIQLRLAEGPATVCNPRSLFKIDGVHGAEANPELAAKQVDQPTMACPAVTADPCRIQGIIGVSDIFSPKHGLCLFIRLQAPAFNEADAIFLTTQFRRQRQPGNTSTHDTDIRGYDFVFCNFACVYYQESPAFAPAVSPVSF